MIYHFTLIIYKIYHIPYFIISNERFYREKSANFTLEMQEKKH